MTKCIFHIIDAMKSCYFTGPILNLERSLHLFSSKKGCRGMFYASLFKQDGQIIARLIQNRGFTGTVKVIVKHNFCFL